MINVKLYGQRTSKYEYIKLALLKRAKIAKIEIDIKEMNRIEDFVRDGIRSIPTVRVNDHINLEYANSANAKDFLISTLTDMLKEEDFGNMKKIIVPTDFSSSANNALVYAVNLARSIQGNIVRLLHCYMPELTNIDGNMLYEPTGEESSKRSLEQFTQKFQDQMAADPEREVLIDSEFIVGAPGEKIVDYSNSYDNEVWIIMGSKGASGVLEKFWGSVSSLVAKRANHPVFIIPPKSQFKNYENIVIAYSEEKLAISSLHWLRDFMHSFSPQIHLVHINTDEAPYSTTELENLIKKHYPKSNVNLVTLKNKNIVSGLNNFITKTNIDLVVLSRKKRGFFQELFHKSVTNEMSLNAKVPLLILHNDS